jgi:hypothetical protein
MSYCPLEVSVTPVLCKFPLSQYFLPFQTQSLPTAVPIVLTKFILGQHALHIRDSMPNHILLICPVLVMHLHFMVRLIDGSVTPKHSKQPAFLFDDILSLVGKGAKVNPTAPPLHI